MEIPVYLAMTASEFRSCRQLPPHAAWLSCLFSPYGRGISNIPKQLPPDSLLIISDKTPICGHDPELIYQILLNIMPQLSVRGLLLDFEGAVTPESMNIVRKLITLPYPVAVSATHAGSLDCPVFVPYPLPSESLSTHLAPWKGRDIWLEISTAVQKITITPSGAEHQIATSHSELPHEDRELHCHYRIDVGNNELQFTLQRTVEDLHDLLDSGHSMGVSVAVGLHQEFI